jgi:2-octaprenyl-6-methoxyphenol hydroxylase
MVERIESEICVIGAGPVGGILACRLASLGVPTVIIDRALLPPMEHPAFDGRAFAIAAGSRHWLESAGIWDRLPLEPCPIHDIRVADGEIGRPASRLFLHFDRNEAGSEAFGHMVEARSLRVALNAQLHALPALTVLAPASIASVTREAEGAIVRVANGPEIHCRLVIAADGRDSALRRQARIAVTRLPYGQSSLVAAISHSRPHHNVALEKFLPAGPFAQLPLAATDAAPNVSAIVWTEKSLLAQDLIGLPDAAFAEEIRLRLGDHLGDIGMVGQRWIYPLSAMHAHRYYDTRLALVGDAAHGIHPIAGQGLNLGFRDSIALTDLILENRDGDTGSEALLRRYQLARRADNLLMLAATDMLDRLFSTDARLPTLARRLGIAAVHRIPPLKRAFMQMAMGTRAA